MNTSVPFPHAAPGGLHSQQNPDGSWEWPITDGLGSIRGMVDATAAPLEGRLYSPYGEPYDVTGTPQTPFGFTGELTDNNGLVYLRSRYYNPTLGLFPSLDPLESIMHDPMSLNRYAYVNANPVNRLDPSGLFSCDAESPAVAGACDELNTALHRAASQKLTFPGTLYQNFMNNKLPFGGLEINAQNAFGVEFGYLTPADSILVNTCTSVSKQYQDTVKRTLVRSVAALVHVVSRLAEAGISDPTTTAVLK